MRLFQVDAFAADAFAGNPAAVCLLGGPAEDRWMQSVASEMNLSETAFVEPRPGGYGLRWFTPVAEVGLCGHAGFGPRRDGPGPCRGGTRAAGGPGRHRVRRPPERRRAPRVTAAAVERYRPAA
ncbi:MAG TPA: PhzF family phenazine biosynthesis protein [Streptosporangiaceae bacterium]|nr:PhzF family phenazine biosynthesis protein [Streptosporangiaceae bacterium]